MALPPRLRFAATGEWTSRPGGWHCHRASSSLPPGSGPVDHRLFTMYLFNINVNYLVEKLVPFGRLLLAPAPLAATVGIVRPNAGALLILPSPRTGAVVTLHQCRRHAAPVTLSPQSVAVVCPHRCRRPPAPVPSSPPTVPSAPCTGVVVTPQRCRCQPAPVPSAPCTSVQGVHGEYKARTRSVQGACMERARSMHGVCKEHARSVNVHQKVVGVGWGKS